MSTNGVGATGNPRERAQMLFDLRRYDDAAQVLREALAREPDDWRLRCELARCLLNLKEHEEGLVQIDRVLHLAPDREWPWRLRALLLARLRRYDDALEAARRAVELAPTLPDTHVVLSQMLRLANRQADARVAAFHAISLAPEDPATHEAYGRVMLELHEPAEAERAFRHMLSLDPSSPVAFNNLGLALQRQGREREATEVFARAAALDPGEQLYRRNVGISAHRLTKMSVPILAITVVGVVIFGLPALIIAGLVAGALALWQRYRLRHGMLHGSDGQPLPPGVLEAMREYQRSRRAAPERIAFLVIVGGAVAVLFATATQPESASSEVDAGSWVFLAGLVAVVVGAVALLWLRFRRRRDRPDARR